MLFKEFISRKTKYKIPAVYKRIPITWEPLGLMSELTINLLSPSTLDFISTLFKLINTYLPTPPRGQDMTQGQFLKLVSPISYDDNHLTRDKYIYIHFSNPSPRAGYDTWSIFKRSLTGLNSEFSFSNLD